MKHLFIILSTLVFFNIAEAQKHAMMNHTDVRIPPARAVRPLMVNTIENRKAPILRIEKETDADETISLENEYALSDKISGDNKVGAIINDDGSYRIFKGDNAVDIFYKSSKTVSVNIDPTRSSVISSKVITASKEMEIDGKSFVCGAGESNNPLSKFSGADNDDIGYQLFVPDNISTGSEWKAATEINGQKYSNNYQIVSKNADHAVIKIISSITSPNEEKHSEGLISVDNATGMITAKHIRIRTSGNVTVKGINYDFESYSTLKMGMD